MAISMIYSLVEYINNHTLVKIICKKHGLFHPTLYNHLYGSGCPHCKQSKLEEMTKAALKKHNVKYESQKTFEWLKSSKNRNMFLDIYISLTTMQQ